MSIKDYIRNFAANRSNEEIESGVTSYKIVSDTYEDLLQEDNFTKENLQMFKRVNDEYLGAFREEQNHRQNS